MPRHHVGAILTFLNVSAVLCFLCSYDLFENQFVFLFECKYNTNNWFKSNISLFLRKKSRKRLRYLLLFMRTQQGNYSAPSTVMNSYFSTIQIVFCSVWICFDSCRKISIPNHGMAVPKHGMAVPNHGTEIFTAKTNHLCSIRIRFLLYQANFSLEFKTAHTSVASETTLHSLWVLSVVTQQAFFLKKA